MPNNRDKRTLPDEEPMTGKLLLKTLLTGFLVGIGSIAPGISGGAIAVVFGLYDRITDAIAHFYQHFGQKMKFLLPLGIGGAAGILLFGQLIGYLFTNYNTPVRCLFIGLMAGTLPSVFRTAGREGFKKRYLLPLVLAAGAVILFTYLDTLTYTGGTADMGWPLLLLCGAVVGFGMIVPGISSSFILMAAGLYEPMLQALNTLDIPKLIPIAIGFGVFVLLFAKLISWLYKRVYSWISYTVCGLLIGSIFPVIPPLRADLAGGLALLLALAGGLLSWYLLRLKSE